ncbi:MAG: DUF4080 domain-containing protein [Anaerovoracaceae bacterium]
MKILLTTLNSKYIHSNLALKYLYGVVAQSGCNVELKEFTINNEDNYIYTELVRANYDIVCFSCYIWNIEKIKIICENLKKAKPEVKILVGGPEVSYDSVTFMEENPAIDYLLRGEGEYPFFQFCKNIVLEDDDFSSVGGMVFRKDGEITVNPQGETPDFEKVPFPYEALDCETDKVLYYEASRGCPYRCSYCLSSIDKTIKALPLERVRRDLGYFIFKEVKQVKFIDRTFNFDRERAYSIWKYLIDNDNGTTNFHFEICGELLDEKTLDLLGKARKDLFQFEIGIQSANPVALKAVNRSESITPILSNVTKLLNLRNSHIHVDLIAGLPYEDYASFGKSFNVIYQLKADNLQLGFLKLLKGTKIREEAMEHGYVFRTKAPYEIISSNYMTSVEMIKLKMIETVLDLYYNKGGFGKTLSFVEPAVAKTPFNFYEQLADFFYSHGFQHKSHKKEDLYRIMRKFIESREDEIKVDGLLDMATELLSQDLEETMNFDAVKKFNKKGWEIQ